MFYLLLFYLFYFQRAVDHDFSRHIYVPKFGAKVLPPWPRVWPGSAGRCVWKSIRSLLPRLSTVLREISQSPEKERRHDHLLVLSQLRINQDTMINGLYASMSAITDGRIFVDNFMSI